MSEKNAAAEAAPQAGGEAEAAKGDQAAAAPPAATMKSVVLTGFGSMKMIKVLQKPEPKPADGEVLIRVKAW
jgi:hypothetical protein